jgi:hypothetical protein
MKQIKDHWRNAQAAPTPWLIVEEEIRRREQLSFCSMALNFCFAR